MGRYDFKGMLFQVKNAQTDDLLNRLNAQNEHWYFVQEAIKEIGSRAVEHATLMRLVKESRSSLHRCGMIYYWAGSITVSDLIELAELFEEETQALEHHALFYHPLFQEVDDDIILALFEKEQDRGAAVRLMSIMLQKKVYFTVLIAAYKKKDWFVRHDLWGSLRGFVTDEQWLEVFGWERNDSVLCEMLSRVRKSLQGHPEIQKGLFSHRPLVRYDGD